MNLHDLNFLIYLYFLLSLYNKNIREKLIIKVFLNF